MPEWIFPTVVMAFGIVLWYLARRIIFKLDAIDAYMQQQMRVFDVRLSVVEKILELRK